MAKKAYVEIVKFRRHFRIYFKNNHPAYIVGEDGDMYIFHRVTHSKSSGGRENWEIIPNPLMNSNKPMRIVKKQEHDNKKRFSPFELEVKKGVDVSFTKIKIKTGSAQTNDGRTNVSSSKNIETNNKTKSKKK